MLLAGLSQFVAVFIDGLFGGKAGLDVVVPGHPEKTAAQGFPAPSFPATKVDSFAAAAGNPDLFIYEEAPSMEKAQEEIHAAPMPALSDESSEAAASLHQRQILCAQVNSEANRVLRRVARKYRLTEEQQSQVFPAIASSMPAYADLAENMNGSVQKTDYASLGIAPEIVDGADANSANDEPDASFSADTVVPKTAVPSAADTPTAASKAKATSAGDDGYAAALQMFMESIEAQLAPFLNNAQLAAMNEEQIDRYYWWGEILIQLDGDIAPEAASAGTVAGDASTASEAVAETEAADAAVSADHQAGTLFDWLNGEDGTLP